MRIWLPALAFFCLVLLTTGGLLGARESLPEKTGHLVVFNMYYANPGMADDVLEIRRYASVVRDRLGLPRGRVLRRINDSDALPDVIWECEFADVAAHDRDMDARAASDAFEGVRDRMRKLIRRFQRTLWQPEVIWQADHPSRGAPRKEAKAIGSTTEFKKVMDHMRTLVRGLERPSGGAHKRSLASFSKI